MADQAPFCIHCGAQQLNADAKFCHRCGQPIVPVKPGPRQLPPWVGPVLVSVAIVVAATIVFARLLSGGSAASETAAATSAPPAAAGTVTPVSAAQSLGAQVTPPTAALMLETPAPPSTETPQPTPTLVGITPGPMRLARLAWSPDGKLLAVGAATGVYLYDTSSWQEVRFIPLQVSVPASFGDGPKELAFSFDSTLLATLGRTVQVWRVGDGSFAYEVKASALLAASPTEGLWATFGEAGSTSGNLRLWRTNDGQLVRTLATGLDFPSSMAFSSDGRLVAAGPMSEGSPGVWQTADGRQISRLNWEMADIFSWIGLAFRPNTATVAAVGGLPEAVLVLWDATSGSLTKQLVALNEMPQGPTLNGVSYAPDGGLLAASFWGNRSQQSKMQLWDADGTRKQSWSLSGQPADIAFSPDSRLLAVLTGQSVLLYNPADGSMARQVEPVWRQGILPTPTPTPLSNLPADWPEIYVTEHPVKVRYPPTWSIGVAGHGFVIYDNPNGSYDSTAMWLTVGVGYCYRKPSPGDPSIVEELKSSAASTVGEQGRLVASGKWPILVPATYVELEGTFQGRRVLSVLLESAPHGDLCFWATLIDEPEDITDQMRLDVSRVLASIEFPDPQHPFPTVTPTYTPTPNPAPAPALPLQISFDAKTSRSPSGGASAEITIEIKDAFGNPVTGAEVMHNLIGRKYNLGVSSDGRYEVSYGGDYTGDKTVTIEVYWNQKLIAQQDFLLSWQ